MPQFKITLNELVSGRKAKEVLQAVQADVDRGQAAAVHIPRETYQYPTIDTIPPKGMTFDALQDWFGHRCAQVAEWIERTGQHIWTDKGVNPGKLKRSYFDEHHTMDFNEKENRLTFFWKGLPACHLVGQTVKLKDGYSTWEYRMEVTPRT